MRVIALINGSMISETAATYAIHYAKSLGLKISFVHIEGKDSMLEIQKSATSLQALAQSESIENSFEAFSNFKKFKSYLQSKDVDMLFCSTRQKRTIFDKSFVKTVIREDLKIDMAIVKVVKVTAAQRVEKVILPIRESKLSVRKFTLFSSIVKAYNAKSAIYSVSKVAHIELGKGDEKVKLKEVIFNLRHYLRLAKLMDFKFSIKHNFSVVEGEQVKSYISQKDYDLAIIGFHHGSSFFGAHPIDILFKKPMINTIYFLPHKDEV